MLKIKTGVIPTLINFVSEDNLPSLPFGKQFGIFLFYQKYLVWAIFTANVPFL